MLTRQAIELDKPVPCRDGDARLWFAADPEDLELAKAQCRCCPLRAACLAGAIERREPCGVWGGEIFDRGQILPVKRRRGRPHANRPARTAAPAGGAWRPRKAMAAAGSNLHDCYYTHVRPQIVDNSPQRGDRWAMPASVKDRLIRLP